MSGHSKWSTIKRQKGITDSKRSAVFTKLARLISVAARSGGGDPDTNFKLRLAIDKAKASNVPNDNIDRAIKAGTGVGDTGQTKEVVYEGFGPGGAAIMIEAVTDNSNRTATEVRGLFTKHSAKLGSLHSVSWMFARRGVVRLPTASMTGEQRQEIELSLIDAGAEDVREEADQLVVIAPTERLHQVQAAVKKSGLTGQADMEFIPTTTVTLDAVVRQKLYALLEALDELDDVTHVTGNDV